MQLDAQDAAAHTALHAVDSGLTLKQWLGEALVSLLCPVPAGGQLEAARICPLSTACWWQQAQCGGTPRAVGPHSLVCAWLRSRVQILSR